MSGFENIDIYKRYDARYNSEEVHYETFSRLAHFFGRDMHPHWHDRAFQLHMLTTGKITLQLDDRFYEQEAPLCIFTPPSVPHAFFTESDSDGHVLTVSQEILWPWVEKLWPTDAEAINHSGICLPLAAVPATLEALQHYWALMAKEYNCNAPGKELMLKGLAQAIFTEVLRQVPPDASHHSRSRGAMRQFRRFNQMVERCFHQHLTVQHYARELGISESALTEICRRFANQSPKKLIFERILREAKRQLLFTSASIHQISFALGYKDPAYFTRFFHRMTGCSPSQFRYR